jgi:hypothetical protein
MRPWCEKTALGRLGFSFMLNLRGASRGIIEAWSIFEGLFDGNAEAKVERE